jgi:hypothetical protein
LRARTIAFAIAFLLLVPSIALAQVPPPAMPSVCDTSQISNYWSLRFGSWPDLCVLGMLISFFIISTVYMFSQALGNPQLTAWCKKEIYEVIITAIIFAGVFGFVNFTCSEIKPSMFVNLDDNGDGIPDHPDDMFLYGIEYLKWLRDASYTVYVLMAFANSLISQLATTMVFSSPGGFGVNLRPLSGLSTISGILTFSMSTLLIGGVLTSIAQLRMLRVIQIMMFNIFLPLGLLCRCFEPTRRFGGSLIAIAIGLFIFYPFLLVLNAGLVQGTILTFSPNTSPENNFMNTSLSDASNYIGPDITNYQTYSSIDASGKRNENILNDPNNFNPAGGPGYTEMTKFNTMFNVIYSVFLRLLIASLFLPLFNFILLITFVRNLSRALGEDVDITNVTRMI